MSIDKKFVESLLALAAKHKLTLDANASKGFDPKEVNFTEWLSQLFGLNCVSHVMEQGESPSGYYPGLFAAYAGATQGEFSPKNAEFDSEDDWETMIIRFESGGKTQKIVVKEVEDSDWFTPEFVVALNKFASKHLSGRWVDFDDGSDGCTSIYVPVAAYSDFLKLRNGLRA